MLHLSTITPSFTRVLLGGFFFLFFFSSNISQSRLETFLVLPSFFREERIKDFVTKKRFSLLLERRRITWRLTACLIVNRGTEALTANALTANLQKNTRNMESFFFFINGSLILAWGTLPLSLLLFVDIPECVGILNISCHSED